MKLDDITALLQEQGLAAAEQEELLLVCTALAGGLQPTEPVRPAFRQELWVRLLAEARRRWRRRAWGATAAVAAAAAVSVFALVPLLLPPPGTTPTPPPAGAVAGGAAGGQGVFVTPGGVVLPQPQLVAYDAGLHPPPPSGVPGLLQVSAELPTGADLPRRALVYRLHPAGWEDSVLQRLAQTFGVGVQQADPAAAAATEPVDGPCGLLLVAADGTLEYRQACGSPLLEATPPVAGMEASRAVAVARRFLAEHGLEQSASGTARVQAVRYASDDAAARVEWDAAVDNRRVVGVPDQVVVASWGEVLYIRLQPVEAEPWVEVALKDAATAAAELAARPVPGGNHRVVVTGVELVYGRNARPLSDEPLVAHPYYRYTGHTDSGAAFVGYVPAAVGSHTDP